MPQKKAKSRGIKLVEASLGQARTLVMAPDNPPDASMADDPAFERRAAAFEQRLAARCFNDPRAQQVAAAMCARIPLYLTARLRRIPDVPARRREMRVIFAALSGQRSFAGTVVQSDPMLDLDTDLERLVLAVMNVITGGNLRERMNLVDQFMHLLDRDLRAAKSFDEIEEIADEAHLDRAALAKRFASGKGKPALLDPAPAKTLLAERDLVRVPTNNRAPFSAMSARDMRLAPPSQGERDHMKAPKSDSKMTFTEGARVFVVNELHPWVQRMRKASLPLKAGPSGHTQIFMEANRYLGVGAPPEHVLLACLGHLLPINAHSLVEILEVAQHHGCAFEAGSVLYRQIAPFSLGELRTIGGGSFPDEASPEAVRKNAHAEQEAQIPRLDDPALAAHKERQTRRQAGLRAEMNGGKAPDGPGPVQRVLASAEARAELDAALDSPIKTWVQRKALLDADRHAAATADADVLAVRELIAAALKAMGVEDPGRYPDAYELCVNHLRGAPLTSNLFTATVLPVLHGGYLNRAERTQGTQDTNRIHNPDYGNPEYAYARDVVEKALHGLPDMHPHFVAEDLQEARKTALLSLVTKASSKLTSGVYAPSRPIIMITSPEGAQRFPLEEALARSGVEYFREREYLRAGPVPKSGAAESSLPGDRPHSAALNVARYRAGGAPSVAYGKSCLVWKEAVKQRSTFTGMDSKDYMFEDKAAHRGGSRKGLEMRGVASHAHPARALRYADPATLAFIVYTAVAPQGKKVKPPPPGGPGMYLPYIEAQIFGEINLARDVAKIVIDEGDLDLWESGKLKTDTLSVVKPRPKDDVKRELTAHAEWLGVPIQFIRTGVNSADPSGAGPYLTEVEPDWEARFDATLRAMVARQWDTARALVVPQAMSGVEPTIKSDTWWSYTSIGLGELDRLRGEAQRFYEKEVSDGAGKMKLEAGQRTPTLARIAAEAIREYDRSALAGDRAYRLDLQRLCVQLLHWIGMSMRQSWKLTEEELAEERRLARGTGARALRPTSSGALRSLGALSGGGSSGPRLPEPPVEKKVAPNVMAHLIAVNGAPRPLTVHDTVGGGDCGVHAMFGGFDAGTGKIRCANQGVVRAWLRDQLLAADGALRGRYRPMLVDLVRRVYLQVRAEGRQSLTRDECTFWDNLAQIAGLEAALTQVYDDEQERYAAAARVRDLIVTRYLNVLRSGDEAARPLLAFLVGELLRSGAKGDQEIRASLERMADRAAQQAEAVAGQPYEALRKQVIANLEGLARPCGAVPALRETVAAYQQYKLDIAGMGGAFGVVVANGLAALVAAYARCVAIDMYYLRQEDLEVLADRDVKGLIIYQEHDLHPGRYREYLVYEAARGAGIIRVFHSGAHYELVTMDG